MNDLADYLVTRMPDGMSYLDSVQLCLHLYCTVDGVPDELQPLSKEILADAFAKLARVGWVLDFEGCYAVPYGAHFHQVTDRGHWIEVIASLFKIGPAVVDRALGESLALRVGFVLRKRRPGI